MFFNKALVNKNTSGSEVDESLYKEGLRDISSFQRDKKIEKSSVSIKDTDIRI